MSRKGKCRWQNDRLRIDDISDKSQLITLRKRTLTDFSDSLLNRLDIVVAIIKRS